MSDNVTPIGRLARTGVLLLGAVSVLVVAGLVPSVAVAEDPTLALVISIESDGTEPFDTGAPAPTEPGGAGLDAGANNGVVKTQDTVTYRIDWSVNQGDATDLVISSTLPVGMTWVAVPPVCLAGSAISTDGATITCNLNTQLAGQTGAVPVIALVGAVANATVLPVSASITAANASTVSTTSVEVVASASAKANLVMAHAQNAMLHNVVAPDSTRGRVFSYPITVEVGGDGKGAEPLQTGADLTFQIDFSALPASTDFADADDYVAPDPVGQLAPRCGPNTWKLYGQPYGVPGIEIDASVVNSTADSGTWACTFDPLTRTMTVVITGANLAPASFPSTDALGQPLPLTRRVFISGMVAVWISDADLIALLPFGVPGQTTLPPSTASWVTVPLGLSGGLTTDDPSDNTYSPSYEYTTYGPFDSYYTYDIGSLTGDVGYGLFHGLGLLTQVPGVPQFRYLIPTQTYDSNVGDGTLIPGELYSYMLQYDARPDQQVAESVAMCAQFSAGQHLVPANWTEFDYNAVGNREAYNAGIPPVVIPRSQPEPVVVGANRFVNQTPFNADPAPSDLVDFVIVEYSTDPGDDSGDCDDTFTWTTTPADVAAVRQVRVRTTRPVDLNESFRVQIALQADLGTPGDRLYTIGSYQTWTGTSYPASGPWNTLTSSSGQSYDLDQFCQSAAYPEAHPDRVFNDCATLTAGALDITKAVTSAQRGLKVGDVVTYQLTAQTLGNVAGSTADVVVVDTLPAGLTFNGVSSLAPTIGAAGDSVLQWDLGTVPNGTVITITYEAVVGGGYTPFEVFINGVTIDGGIDDGNGTIIPLPQRSAQAAVQASGSFARLDILKSTSTPEIDQNASMRFDLVYTNTGTDDVGGIDVIDVLPYNGDGRFTPTAFSGSTSLLSITASGQHYVTNAAQATVVVDGGDASNALPAGATVWCEVPGQDADPAIPNVGDASCPATLGEATAVRIIDPSTIRSGDRRTIGLEIDTTGNVPGDIYTNDFGARVGGLRLPVVSNEATVIVRGIDLSLTKTVDRSAAVVGDSVVYTITIANAGPSTVPAGATASDSLPPGLTFVSASDGGMLSGSTITWVLPELAAGASVTRVVTVTAAAVGVWTNVAEVVTADGVDRDSTPGNGPLGEDDDDSAVVEVTEPPVVLPPTTPQPTTPTTIPPRSLPSTGSEALDSLSVALAATAAGAALVLVTRRRRTS